MNLFRNGFCLAILGAAAAMPAITLGDTTPEAAPASPHTITANVALVSDYRFRGLSQTYFGPAIQGGFDYTHASGFYLGTWGSNVSGNEYLSGNGMEWDMYGGYRKAFGDFTLDGGVLYYFYPSARLPTINPAGSSENYDTVELYASGAWKWLTLKYSYSLTDLFGVQNSTYGGACNIDGADCFGANPGSSQGSGYLDLTGTYPVTDKLSLVAHVAHQWVHNYGKLDYTDWKIGATYTLLGFNLGLAYVDTDADSKWVYASGASHGIRKIGEATAVLSIARTF